MISQLVNEYKQKQANIYKILNAPLSADKKSELTDKLKLLNIDEVAVLLGGKPTHQLIPDDLKFDLYSSYIFKTADDLKDYVDYLTNVNDYNAKYKLPIYIIREDVTPDLQYAIYIGRIFPTQTLTSTLARRGHNRSRSASPRFT